MTITLRPYQQDVVNEVRKSFAEGYKCPLLVAATGAGKTVMFSYIAKNAAEKNNAIIIAAHRKEIIRQISLSLARFALPHSVIAAPALVRQIKVAQFKAFGKSFVDTTSSTMVGSVQTMVGRFDQIDATLNNLSKKLGKKAKAIVIQDECFPAGVKVDGKSIESLKVGDMVRSVNHLTGIVEQKRIMQLFKSRPKSMCTVHLSDGTSMSCTEGHPFFVPFYGYFNAKELKPNMPIFKLQTMRRGSKTGDSISFSENEEARMDFLRNSLLKRVQVEGLIRNNGEDEQKVRIRQNEAKESNESFGDAPEDARNIDIYGAQASVSWREWPRNDGFSSRDISEAKGGVQRSCFGTRCKHWNSKRNGVSTMLQGGCCDSAANDCNRGGWLESPVAGEKGSRPKEDRSSSIVWVESVEIHEQTSDGKFGGLLSDGFVYNIEVEKNHNYFVDGILVHNCHHVVQGTAWGKVMDRYGPSVGNVSLIVTASPQRLDGRGLGKGHCGYEDTIIEAPPMRWLIENGFLSPYRVFTAQHQIDVSSVKTRMGDYAASDLQEVVDKPQITGDAITHWRKHANGLKTAIFCVSVEHSKHVAAEFNENGIPAAHIDGGTDDSERDKAIVDFANGKIMVITNVNILSEGFDLASIAQQDVTIDCVVDLAPTQSLVNALQRWGRALRPAAGKTAILLDHAGNVMRHGLPDEDRDWTLEGVKKKKRKTEEDDEDDVKVKCCPECFSIHEPQPVCPNCGHVYEIKARKIEHIEGELKEIQQAQIEQMRKTKMLQQGKAQTVHELVAQGMSRGRAEKIIEARLAKQALQEEIFNKLSEIQVKTGFGPYQTCGFTRADILRMKPKELKALSVTITTVNN